MEAVRTALDRAGRVNPKIRAYMVLDQEEALRSAERLDRSPVTERGALFGLPVAVKDNIAVKGLPSSSGSKLLRGYRPPFDATVVRRLQEAGAVILGITNLDEFGMGSATTRSHLGATRNPADPKRIAGGSSGGSAAAVAAGAAFAALGTDTGGSVRQPAAHCGVFGVRPTYGRVSRFGITAYASSFDQVGCLAPDLEDLARVLGAIAGVDPRDATTAARPVPDYRAAADRPAFPHTIAACAEEDLRPLDPASRMAFGRAVRRFRQAGCRILRTALPDTEIAVAAYYLLVSAEASSNLARFEGMRYGRRRVREGPPAATFRETRVTGFGAEVRKRILLGTTVLSRGYRDALYREASRTRRHIRDALFRVLDRAELLLLPVTVSPPRLVAEPDPPRVEYRGDRFTILAALAGLPAISIPAGERSGLPFGIELMGSRWNEAGLFSAAAAFDGTDRRTPA